MCKCADCRVTDTISTRVARGLQWLRTEGADVFGLDVARIDVETLDIEHGDCCALAQAGGDGFLSTLEDIELSETIGDESSPGWATRHGFWPLSGESDALTQEWRRQLTQ
jgi:hypothetical protein